ncbi:hypothetical protein DFH06DRAFT_1118548 [Mycena polygramma]|nr:hypothetical protein DFH06DRAFT_1118548 [Mycena polygramma]
MPGICRGREAAAVGCRERAGSGESGEIYEGGRGDDAGRELGGGKGAGGEGGKGADAIGWAFSFLRGGSQKGQETGFRAAQNQKIAPPKRSIYYSYGSDEEERIARHTAKDKGKEVPQAIRPRTDKLTMNLIDWLDQGEESAYEKFKFIAQNASVLPAEYRAEGEAYVLSQQQRIEANWWTTTCGGPRSNCAERIAIARNGGSSSSHAPAPGVSMGRTPNSQQARDEDVVMEDGPPNAWSFESIVMRVETPPPPPTTTQRPSPPRMDGFRCDAPGYLGHSASNVLDLAPASVAEGEFRVWQGLPNTTRTVVEVGRHYAFANPTWTAGICNALGEHPARSSDDVHVGDTLAFQTLIALGPADRRSNSHQWRGFFEPAIMMLSIPGFYAYIVSVGRYPSATLDMEPFRRPTNNATMPIEVLESFACSRCNVRANVTDLNSVGWVDEPRNAKQAMAVDVASIPS